MLHHGDMRVLQGGAEGGRVWLSQGLGGGDPLPVQEKEVCVPISVLSSWCSCSLFTACLLVLQAGPEPWTSEAGDGELLL